MGFEGETSTLKTEDETERRASPDTQDAKHHAARSKRTNKNNTTTDTTAVTGTYTYAVPKRKHEAQNSKISRTCINNATTDTTPKILA